MRKQLFLDLVERLKKEVYDISVDNNGDPVLDNAGKPVRIPKIKHFDLWNRQIEYLSKENPFTLPAVFIEFSAIEYKQLGHGVQEADLAVKLHVINKVKGSSADGKATQELSLAHLDLLDDIHYALYGYNTTYSGPLTRTGSMPNHDHDEIVEEVEIYRTAVSDLSGVRRVVEAEMAPTMEFHFHKRY